MKSILSLSVVLFFAAVVTGCGSQSASSHDFIDLETNYDFSNVSAPLYRYLKENNEYSDDDDDSYIGYLCDEETDWEAITFSVSVFCADISCPLRGLDANGCIEHCKKFLQRPSGEECALHND